jgi:mannose-6-phosphate isomerase
VTVATVHRVEGTVRTYAWGSRTALAELTGRPLPTDHPDAVLWLGAHPAAACRLEGSEGSVG